jgi:hypothetical protein
LAGDEENDHRSPQALLAVIRPAEADSEGSGADCYARCGRLRAPTLVRMGVLDPTLGARLGGAGEISAPPALLARLALPASKV